MVIIVIIVAIIGATILTQAFITGEIHIRGGKWITTKSMPNNPILRSQTPRDYWFVMVLIAFIFLVMPVIFLVAASVNGHAVMAIR